MISPFVFRFVHRGLLIMAAIGAVAIAMMVAALVLNRKPLGDAALVFLAIGTITVGGAIITVLTWIFWRERRR